MLLRGGSAVLIECKWSELPRPRDAAPMTAVAAILAGAKPDGVALEAAYVAARPASAFPLAGTAAWAVHGTEVAARCISATTT